MAWYSTCNGPDPPQNSDISRKTDYEYCKSEIQLSEAT